MNTLRAMILGAIAMWSTGFLLIAIFLHKGVVFHVLLTTVAWAVCITFLQLAFKIEANDKKLAVLRAERIRELLPNHPALEEIVEMVETPR